MRCRALLAFACLTLAGGARAETRGLDLSWEAPAECASARAVEADIASLMQGPAVNDVRARAQVRREDATWILELRTETTAGVRTRELRGASCAELAGAAAAVLALEVGGVATATLPEPPHDQAPAPAEEPRAPREGPAAAAPEQALSSPTTPTTPTPTERAFSVGVDGAATAGAIGGAALGVGLNAAWLPGRERLELAAAFYPSSHVDRADLGIGGDFSLFAAGLGACHGFRWAALSMGPCLGAELGRVGATGTGTSVASASTQSGLWFAGRVGGLAVFDLGRFALRAEVDAVVPFVRDSFAIRGIDDVYKPAAVAGRLLLGVEAHFR